MPAATDAFAIPVDPKPSKIGIEDRAAAPSPTPPIPYAIRLYAAFLS